MRTLRLVSSVLLLASFGACLRSPQEQMRPAPAFDLPKVGSGKLSLADLKGKVVVLDFWATWCGPCIGEIPEYVKLWNENHARGVEVVAVAIESGETQDIVDFLRENNYKVPYTQLVGDDAIEEAYGVNQGLPTTFVIDGQGRIRAKMLGSDLAKFKRLQDTVDELLAGESRS